MTCRPLSFIIHKTSSSLSLYSEFRFLLIRNQRALQASSSFRRRLNDLICFITFSFVFALKIDNDDDYDGVANADKQG
ncbi:hypothetical protein PTKIN_Ptkin03bG0057000 [Pterospermum kingtungense]